MDYRAKAEIDGDRIALIATSAPSIMNLRVGRHGSRRIPTYADVHRDRRREDLPVQGHRSHGQAVACPCHPRETSSTRRIGLDAALVANSSRQGTRTAENIGAEPAKLEERFDVMLAEAEAIHRQEAATLLGEDMTPVTSVSKQPACAKKRQAKLKKALDTLRTRHASGWCQKAVAMSDPDAPILPNKGGGFGLNHPPVNAGG